MRKRGKRLLSLCLAAALAALLLPAPAAATEDDAALDEDISLDDGMSLDVASLLPDDMFSQMDLTGDEESGDQSAQTGQEQDGDAQLPDCSEPLAETVNVQDNAGNWYCVVQLQWAPVDGALRYQILRRTQESEAWETVGYSSETSYEDYDVTVGTTYYYTVCVADTSGEAYSGTGSEVFYPSGSCGEQAQWRLLADGTLEITGTGAMEDSYSMDRYPWYPLRDEVLAASVGEGITSLSGYAFADCTNLQAVSLPDSLTAIGRYAFFNCTSLSEIELPQGITEIPERAFYLCTGLSEITLPEQLRSIGLGAFDSCQALTGLTLPDSLTEIGKSAFAGCKSLTAIAIPQGVTELGLNTFFGCTSLVSVQLSEGLVTLGPYVFANCIALTSLTLPATLTSIGQGALSNCTSLTTLRFLGSYPTVGASALPTQNVIYAYYPVDDESWTEQAREALGDQLIWNTEQPTEPTEPEESEQPEEEQITCATPEVSVSNTTGGLLISWQAIEGAQEYRVFRWNETKNGWDQLADTQGTQYIDTSVVSGETYRYTVRCLRNGSYSGDYDRTVQAVRYLAVPSLQVANSAGGVTITWQAVDGAAQYVVYRRTVNGQWGRIAVLGTSGALQYTDGDVQSGTYYYYTVKAFRLGESSDFDRNVYCYYLAQPSVTVAQQADSVTVSWSKRAGTEGYRIYRKVSGSNWLFVTEVSADTLSYTDTTVQSGTSYAYTVRARGGGALSSYDPSASLTFLTQPEVTVYNGSQGGGVLWNKVDGAVEYRIYRKTPGGSWTRIAIVDASTLQYVDTSVKNANGSTYLYTVRAGNGRTLSNYDAGVALLRLTLPSIAGLTASGSGITVTWSRNTSATGYQFQYATNAGLSGAVTFSVSSGSTVSQTITGLEKGKTYYVRMRVVSVSSDGVDYSPWSSVKQITLS